MTIKFLLSLVFFCSLPLMAHAAAVDFIPRLARSNAVLRLESRYLSETDTVERDGNTAPSREKNTLSFQETLQFGTSGYVYHPDLFFFSSSLAGIVSSTRQANSAGSVVLPSQKTHGLTEGYTFYGELLRRKPLSAEMRFSRDVPSGSGIIHTELYQRQLQLFYVKRPFTSSLEYIQNGREDIRRLDIGEQYRMNAVYSSPEFNIQGNAVHVNNRSEQNLSNANLRSSSITKADTIHLANQWLYKFMEFRTAIEWQDRDSSDGRRAETRLREDVEAELPWDFNLRVNLTRVRNVIYLGDSQTGKSASTNESASFGLSQKLFESLRSRVGASYQNTISNSGRRAFSRYGYGTDYNKKLRTGGLSAGTSFESTFVDNIGRVEDKQTFADKLPGNKFLLFRPDIDLSTLRIELIMCDDNDWCSTPYRLQENEHWIQKNPATNSVEIQLTDNSTPGSKEELEEFIIAKKADNPTALSDLIKEKPGGATDNYTYTYTVIFSTNNLDYIQETNYTDAYVGLTLLGNMLKSKYIHSYTTQKISEGEAGFAEILAPIVTTDDLELSFDYGPFSLSADYRLLNNDYDTISKRNNPVLKSETWAYGANFRKRAMFIPKVSTVFKMNYSKTFYNTEYGDGDDTGDKYSVVLDARSSLVIPALKARITHAMSYEKKRGNFTEFIRNSVNQSIPNPVSDDDIDLYESEIHVTWQVPRTKIAITSFADYRNEKHADGPSTIATNYGARSGYRWNFGATSLNVSGEYEVEGNKIESIVGGVTKTTNEDWSVHATMTRKLF